MLRLRLRRDRPLLHSRLGFRATRFPSQVSRDQVEIRHRQESQVLILAAFLQCKFVCPYDCEEPQLRRLQVPAEHGEFLLRWKQSWELESSQGGSQSEENGEGEFCG